MQKKGKFVELTPNFLLDKLQTLKATKEIGQQPLIRSQPTNLVTFLSAPFPKTSPHNNCFRHFERYIYCPGYFCTLLLQCIFIWCFTHSGIPRTHFKKPYNSTRANTHNAKPDSHKFFLWAGFCFNHRRLFELCHLAYSLMFEGISHVPFTRKLDEGSWYKSRGRNGPENKEL